MYPSNRKRSKTNSSSKTRQQNEQLSYEFVDDLKKIKISSRLQETKATIKAMFENCSDCVQRSFEIEKGIPALAVNIDGLVNSEMVDDALQALMILEKGVPDVEKLNVDSLPVSQFKLADNYGDLIIAILGGDTAVFVEGNRKVMLLGIRGPKGRSISEPETEAVVRGPREGFVENLRVNTSLLRRRIKTPRLKMKPMKIGKQTNTNIVISYIDGIVSPSIVEEVEQRLSKIDMDAILESGYIEEMIQDSSFSPFPQIQYTERPDTTAAALLQGRVAIFTDGTPFVLLAPSVLWNFMQANEDYYERFEIATLIRWLRYLFFILALLTPAMFVATITFHQDMLPTTLLLSIAAAREHIPFPALIEALLMEITFEALREAGVRLPKTIGQAVSILGALVVGQAAVMAGIVSAPMVIVVAMTGIASFTIPRFNAAISIRMLRFPLLLLAGTFGMYGILLGVMVILCHLAALRSFGIPYLSPAGPLSLTDMKDVLIRSPWWTMDRRPAYLPIENASRMGRDVQHEIAKQGGGQKGEQIEHEQSMDDAEGADHEHD